jgi:hypothetical protein
VRRLRRLRCLRPLPPRAPPLAPPGPLQEARDLLAGVGELGMETLGAALRK